MHGQRGLAKNREVFAQGEEATEAMLQLIRSPSPSPTSPAGPVTAAPISPELVELTSQPGSAEGCMAMPLSPQAEKVSKAEMESRQRKDKVLGGQEAA